jgi:hypothetical protein
MAGIGVRVEGLRKTVKALQDAGVAIDDLKGVFGGVAALGARLAKGFAPKRTGNLAGTIRGNRAKNKAVIIAGRARFPYAGPVNYGWEKRNIKPRLYMQAVDPIIGPKAVEMLDEGLSDAIKKAGLDG